MESSLIITRVLLIFCSLVKLSKMFELPLSSVHSIVSKMIIKDELLVSYSLNGHSELCTCTVLMGTMYMCTMATYTYSVQA